MMKCVYDATRAVAAAIAILSVASAARAQSAAAVADGHLCALIADQHQAGAREEAVRITAGGGARGAFFEGCTRMGDAKPNEAADAFERALRGEESNPIWHGWLGRAYGEQTENANIIRQALLARRARKEFERAIELAPDYLDARDALLQFDLQAPSALGGGVDKARAQAAEITKRDVHHGAMARLQIARHERDTTAIQHEDEFLVTQYPDSAGFRTPLITVLVTQKKWSEAWAAVDQFERTFANDPRATYAVGRVAAESGEQLARGERALRSYLTRTPQRGEPTLAGAHYRLGQILERQANIAAARHEYETAVALDSTLAAAKNAVTRLR